MSNYQSYQAYQAPAEEPRVFGPTVAIRDTMSRVTMSGDVVTETSATGHKTTTSELNQFLGTGTFAESARNQNGVPVTELLPTTLVTIGGMQAPIATFVSAGLLVKTASGSYAEPTAQTVQAPQADTSDVLPISEDSMAQVNLALDSVDQGNLDSLMAVGMGVVTGRLDPSALAHKFGQVSGYGGEEGAARLAVVRGAYQAQADEALTTRAGLRADDLPEFYQWARENRQGKLQETLHKQLRMHDVSGWKELAAQWMAATPPSINTLKAGGFSVRDQGGKHEVFVQGSWMTPGAAARAGLL
jgi:hypothetical protein